MDEVVFVVGGGGGSSMELGCNFAGTRQIGASYEEETPPPSPINRAKIIKERQV